MSHTELIGQRFIIPTNGKAATVVKINANGGVTVKFDGDDRNWAIGKTNSADLINGDLKRA